MAHARMSDDQLRARWIEAGGEFHGPNIETGTMPEARLLPFLRSLLAPAAQHPGYYLDPACVQALAEEARKFGQERVTFGVMEPNAGFAGLPAYRAVVSESLDNLLGATPPQSERESEESTRP